MKSIKFSITLEVKKVPTKEKIEELMKDIERGLDKEGIYGDIKYEEEEEEE